MSVKSATDIDFEIQRQFNELYMQHAITLWCMNSVNLVVYLKPGSYVYIFTSRVDVFNADIKCANKYSDKFSCSINLSKLHLRITRNICLLL